MPTRKTRSGLPSTMSDLLCRCSCLSRSSCRTSVDEHQPGRAATRRTCSSDRTCLVASASASSSVAVVECTDGMGGSLGASCQAVQASSSYVLGLGLAALSAVHRRLAGLHRSSAEHPWPSCCQRLCLRSARGSGCLQGCTECSERPDDRLEACLLVRWHAAWPRVQAGLWRAGAACRDATPLRAPCISADGSHRCGRSQETLQAKLAALQVVALAPR